MRFYEKSMNSEKKKKIKEFSYLRKVLLVHWKIQIIILLIE